MKKKQIIMGMVVLFLVAVYIGISIYFQSHFFPNTTVNGIDASSSTVKEVKEEIRRQAGKYTITIKLREGRKEQILGKQIGLKPVFNGKIEDLIKKQNAFQWPMAYFKKNTLVSKTAVAYDKEKMKQTVKNLECMRKGRTAPQDAYVSEYKAEKGYEIIPEVQGNTIKKEKLYQVLDSAVLGLKDSISLEKEQCYKKPKVTKRNKKLKKECKTLNKYVGASITYTFGEATEILNGETINQWLQVGEDHAVTIREDLLSEFISNMASKHNTVFHAKKLKTSYGPTITIENGDYGWWIDKDAERTQLLSDIQSGKQITREPVYKQRAASFGENDYGSTYVEINLTAQHLFFYKNGALVTESDFVSGNVSKNYATPTGAYSLTYKQRDAVLGGRAGFDYSTPVSYWMPFCNNVGMHDAYWRKSFGGSIYKTNGSHGCVNLPPAIAEKIFGSIEKGDPVLVYELSGTETKTEEEKQKELEEQKKAQQETTGEQIQQGPPADTSVQQGPPADDNSQQQETTDEQIQQGPPADDE